MALVWTDLSTADENAFRGGMLFDTERWSWDESEVDGTLQPVNNIFRVKGGVYRVEGTRTVLLFGATQVGFLEGFNPASAQTGNNGQGGSDETGVAFNWIVSPYYAETTRDGDELKQIISRRYTNAIPPHPQPIGPPHMGTGFDFFADCHSNRQLGRSEVQFLRRNELSPFFIFEALELILLLAQIYDSLSGNKDNSSKMMEEVNQKLDQIQAKLELVNTKLDQVLSILSQLPAIIRGTLENVVVKQALGECSGIAQEMQDKLKPGIVDQSAALLEQYAHDLVVKLKGIEGVRGISSVIVAAPYMSIYLAATVAAQKAMKRANPDHIIDSPWQRGFVKNANAAMGSLMRECFNQDREYYTTVSRMPNHRDSYMVFDGKFAKVADGAGHGFSITCPSHPWGETVYGSSGPITSGPVHDAWNAVLQTRAEITAFYQVVPDVFNAQDSLLKAFVEPDGMWNINT